MKRKFPPRPLPETVSDVQTVAADAAEKLLGDTAAAYTDGDLITSNTLPESTPSDLINGIELKRADDETHLQNGLLENFTQNASADREMRKNVGWFLIILFSVEAIFALIIMALWGVGWMSFPQWVATVFFTSVFGQIAGMLYVVVRYLFQGATDQLLMAFIQHRKHGD